MIPPIVNGYDPVAAGAILSQGELMAGKANAAFDAANPRPSEKNAFAQWFANRNAYRKNQVEGYLNQVSPAYNAANPPGYGTYDPGTGVFTRDDSNHQNQFIPGGKYADIGEAERRDALRRLATVPGAYPDIQGRERAYALDTWEKMQPGYRAPVDLFHLASVNMGSTAGGLDALAPAKPGVLQQIADALFGKRRRANSFS